MGSEMCIRDRLYIRYTTATAALTNRKAWQTFFIAGSAGTSSSLDDCTHIVAVSFCCIVFLWLKLCTTGIYVYTCCVFLCFGYILVYFGCFGYFVDIAPLSFSGQELYHQKCLVGGRHKHVAVVYVLCSFCFLVRHYMRTFFRLERTCCVVLNGHLTRTTNMDMPHPLPRLQPVPSTCIPRFAIAKMLY